MSQTLKFGNEELTAEEVLEKASTAGKIFATVALFSIINSALIFFETGLVFPVGLGVSMFFGGLITAAKTQPGVISTVIITISVIFNIGASGIFYLISRQANKCLVWWARFGIFLYFIDSLIILMFEDWISLAFHAFFLLSMMGSISLIKLAKQANKHLEESENLNELEEQPS